VRNTLERAAFRIVMASRDADFRAGDTLSITANFGQVHRKHVTLCSRFVAFYSPLTAVAQVFTRH